MSATISKATYREPKSTAGPLDDVLKAEDVGRLPGHLIRLAQQVHNRLWVNEVSSEITSPQYGILNAILASPGIDQKTVGEEVGIDKSTVGDVVNRLVERGLVIAARDLGDQRRNILRLSRAGRRAAADIAPRAIRMNQKLVSTLNTDDQERLIHLLVTVIQSAADENGEMPGS